MVKIYWQVTEQDQERLLLIPFQSFKGSETKKYLEAQIMSNL